MKCNFTKEDSKTIVYMSGMIMFVQQKYVCSQEMSSSERVRKSTGWIFNNVYYGGRSFAAGDTSNVSDKPSTYEKCILFGFSLISP